MEKRLDKLENKIEGIGKSLDKTKIEMEDVKRKITETRAMATSSYHGYSALAERIQSVQKNQGRLEGKQDYFAQKLDMILTKMGWLPFKFFAMTMTFIGVLIGIYKLIN